MPPTTAKLTIRLPSEHIAFAKRYAKANGMTVTEVIDRYLRRMRTLDDPTLAPELSEISGLIPTQINTDSVLEQQRLDKYG